jgi:hypothetical protein
MAKIKRIRPLSLGKVFGIASGFISLLYVIFKLILLIFLKDASRYGLNTLPLEIIYLPMFAAIFGFIYGIMIAAIYNLIASRFCAIEIDLE